MSTLKVLLLQHCITQNSAGMDYPPLAYRKLGSAWAALRFWPACQHRLGV